MMHKPGKNNFNASQPEIKTSGQAAGGSFWKSRENMFFLSAILLISFIVYLPSLQNGFVNWDDGPNIYENPNILSISSWSSFLTSVGGIFASHVIGNYNPLPILTFAFEKLFYGFDRLWLWHLDNILLHLACVLLVFRIALALGLKRIPAAFCALLFGIQPMRVESVAWLTERKDLLYGSFYLFGLYYYIKGVSKGSRKRYELLVLASFVLALLSKIQAVVFPLSMLLVDYYFDRKMSLHLVWEKWFYFVLSLITGVVGVYILKHHGSVEVNQYYPFWQRSFLASYAYVLYIIKSVIPYRLTPIYPEPFEMYWWFYVSMAPALAVFAAMYLFFRKQRKVLVFGLLFFTFNIMFLLQFLGAGTGFLADRFTYIAYFGLFFIYGCGLQWTLEKYQKFSRDLYCTAFLILGIFGYMNFEQNKVWENGETLWTHALKYYGYDSFAWVQRGHYYKQVGRRKEAIDDFSRAAALKTANPAAYNERGYSYLQANNPDLLRLAVEDFTRAIKISPEESIFFLNRGAAYIRMKMFDKALIDLGTAERLDPQNHNIYYNRYILYYNRGDYDKLVPEAEKYLSLNPSNPDMWAKLGVLFRMEKEYVKALNALNEAIRLVRLNLDYYYERLKTFHEMGDLEGARNDLNFLRSKGFTEIDPLYENALIQKEQ